MFSGFSQLKIGLKIVLGILFVEFISLASGITIGVNYKSHWVVLGCLSTIVISQYVAWLVSDNISKSVKNVLEDLSETSGNLSALSSELTTTAHKLAEGSTEQAASIQETSSTLEESSSMVHQTTQNTKEADNLAKQTKDYANKGNEEMQVMVSSMEELKKSSDEIAKIIRVIDEIAFQTNILSLNAAVEAARAGDAGKGFAVVAEEVRNLAQRSAQAAKDTAVIIESNISLSEKCLAITSQVSSSLVEIRNETNKVSELLEEISTASQEQEIGIAQINQAVSQMEHVIQSNATTARESANSADQLGTYSDTIKGIMSALSTLISGNKELAYSVKSIGLRSKTEVTVKQGALKRPKLESAKSEPKKLEKVKALAGAKSSEPVKSAPKPEDIIPLDDF